MDELKNLKHMPKPSENAKKKAINLAIQEFSNIQNEQKKKKTIQGFFLKERLTVIFNKIKGIRKMAQKFSLNIPILTGTAVATLVLVVFITAKSWHEENLVVENNSAEIIKNENHPESRTSQFVPNVGLSNGLGVNDNITLDKRRQGKPLAEEKNIKFKSELYNRDADTISKQYSDSSRARPYNNDKFQSLPENEIKKVKQEPLTTFSIDVDTVAYSFVRKSLNSGVIPPKEAVRVEEMINYFNYNYPIPDSDKVFSISTSIFKTPWNNNTKLMHIGIQGHKLKAKIKPKSNLVFLIDVSGSMEQRDKLPLLKASFKMLLDNLSPNDNVSIVTYAGNSAVVLQPTKVSEKNKIITALNNLQSGGSTAGASGIIEAYNLAQANFDSSGVNRVILATDGDFNVGISSNEKLKELIKKKRQSGIFLSILGFGMGNYNDHLMQTLAQNGNGVASYIDNINEAYKVLVEEAEANIFPIAKDVKIQIEFNPNKVSEYRLIGYETRNLRNEDFNNDKIDAGDIGAGHQVTAIYEITPVGNKPRIDSLRYEGNKRISNNDDFRNDHKGKEYAFLKLRYKKPTENKSYLITSPIYETIVGDCELMDVEVGVECKNTISEEEFSTAVAAFAQLLKGSNYLGSYSYADIISLANKSIGKDKYGYRSEFIKLAKIAKSLGGN